MTDTTKHLTLFLGGLCLGMLTPLLMLWLRGFRGGRLLWRDKQGRLRNEPPGKP